MWHCGESLLDLIVPNQGEEAVETSLDSQVLHAALVLGDVRLVGVGQEVHEEEHQQMQSFPINFFNVQTSDSQIFQVEFIIQNSTLACESANGV